jgi:Protein of unknown function (DUF4231)
VDLGNPTVERLEEQIRWYDRKGMVSQRWFKWLKIAQIGTAAVIPFASGFGAPPLLIGGFGVLIVCIEGLQSLNQYEHNWIAYRSTCEELKHEKYLWLAKAGVYASADNPDTLLAERVESLIARENAKWVSVLDQTEQEGKSDKNQQSLSLK